MQAVAILGYLAALAVSSGTLAGCGDAARSGDARLHRLCRAALLRLSLLVLGYLIIVARFVPRLLGILMFVAAAGYLTDSFAKLLRPDLAGITAVLVGVTALVGELPFFIWLLVKGFGKKNREATS